MEIVARLRCPFCWGPFEARTLTGTLLNADSYGTLACGCGEFPILNGIPILDRRHNEQRLLALVRRQRWSQATSECLMADVEANGVTRICWRLLRKLDISNRLWARVAARSTCRDALQVGYRKSGAYHEYLRCRFGDPTFVAGEWTLAHAPPVDGWILDVPSGVGHFEWVLHRHHPNAREKLVAADASFFNLLLLKLHLLPRAAAICLDANMRLPFEAGHFTMSVSTDGWHYLDAQAQFLHELVRVTQKTGTVVLLHVHNQGAKNRSPGKPVGYRALERWLDEVAPGRQSDIDILDERAFADRAWDPSPADSPFDYPAAPHAPVFDVWMGDRGRARLANAPTEAGHWIVNPLYRRAGGTRYVRTFGNPDYAEEFAELTTLLPAEVDLDGSIDDLAADPALTLTLIQKRVLLFVPKGY